jgi:hypothetical protein
MARLRAIPSFAPFGHKHRAVCRSTDYTPRIFKTRPRRQIVARRRSLRGELCDEPIADRPKATQRPRLGVPFRPSSLALGEGRRRFDRFETFAATSISGPELRRTEMRCRSRHNRNVFVYERMWLSGFSEYKREPSDRKC